MEGRNDGGGRSVGHSVGGGGPSSSRFISQIFWPEHCLSLGGRRGYLIGWNTAAFKCLVVTLVTVDAETGLPTLAQTERALEILSSDPRCHTLNEFCSSDGAPPTVLGEWLPNGPPRQPHGGASSGSSAAVDPYHDGGAASAAAARAAEAAATRRQSANIWLTVGQKAGRPVLRSLYCCGCAYRTCCYVVFYRPCNPDVLEYLPTNKKNASAYENSGGDDDDGGGGSDDGGTAAPKPGNSSNGQNSPPSSAGYAAASAAAVGASDGGGDGDADASGSKPSSGRNSTTGDRRSSPPRYNLGDTVTSTSINARITGGAISAYAAGVTNAGSRNGTSGTASSSSRRGAGNTSSTGRRVLRRGRVGHGTALVSPSAREQGNPGGVARDAAGLLMGGGAGGSSGGSEDLTDLDLAIRQVSCALTLERALRNVLRDILIAEKSSKAGTASPPPASPGAAAAAAAAAYTADPHPIGGRGSIDPSPGGVGVMGPLATATAGPRAVEGMATLSGTPTTGREEVVAGAAVEEEEQDAEEAWGAARSRERQEDASADFPESADPSAASASADATGLGGVSVGDAGAGAGATVSSTPETEAAAAVVVAGGREAGAGDGAGKAGRRSVSFADEGGAGEGSATASVEPLADPSAPPAISRRRTRPVGEEADAVNLGGFASEGLASREGYATGVGAGGRGAAAASHGKPPIVRRPRDSRRRGRGDGTGSSSGDGTSSRRKGVLERQEAEEEAGAGPDRGGQGGLVSLPGRVLLDGCCLVLRVSSFLALLAVRVLEAKIVWTPLGNEPWRSPSDASLVCAHLAARLKGALSLPFRLSRCWRERHQPAERRVEGLVGLSHWLFGLAADSSLGIVACVLLLRHTGAASGAAHQALHLLHVDVLREELEWLNYFPAGFKLNVPLTHTLGSLTLIGMEAYASIVGKLAQWEGAAMKAVAVCAATGGLTTALAVCHDVLRLLTMHTATTHTAFAALHNLHSSLLGSLWQLFRGRKRNVLRCRVDTCMYDACQLLLGTLVFTVLSFLTPTISVYYTFFCIVQAVSVGGQGVLMSMFVLVNELPVYRFLLLLTSPGRLLSGFQLQVLDAALPASSGNPASSSMAAAARRESSAPAYSGIGDGKDGGGAAIYGAGGEARQWDGGANMVYFQLRRCRAPVSALFQPYVDRARRAARRYPPGVLVKSLISGKPLPDVGFRDFVTVRSGGLLGRRGETGEAEMAEWMESGGFTAADSAARAWRLSACAGPCGSSTAMAVDRQRRVLG